MTQGSTGGPRGTARGGRTNETVSTGRGHARETPESGVLTCKREARMRLEAKARPCRTLPAGARGTGRCVQGSHINATAPMMH